MLFRPSIATRVRYSMYTDTPVPPDEPMAENPPEGAVIDYWLAADAKGPVTLEILDAQGKVIRKYSSDDKFDAPHDVGNWPWYWYRPLHPLSTKAGLQRYVWDLHLPVPPAPEYGMPISATPYNTLPVPRGPFVAPGKYTAKLTVDGTSYTQQFSVRMDPRVKTPAAALVQQYALSVQMADGAREAATNLAQVRALRGQLKARRVKADAKTQAGLDSLDAKLAALDPAPGASGGLAAAQSQMLGVMQVLQEADIPPTTAAITAAGTQSKAFKALEAKWTQIEKVEVPAMNAQLKALGLDELTIDRNAAPVAGESAGGEDEP